MGIGTVDEDKCVVDLDEKVRWKGAVGKQVREKGTGKVGTTVHILVSSRVSLDVQQQLFVWLSLLLFLSHFSCLPVAAEDRQCSA